MPAPSENPPKIKTGPTDRKYESSTAKKMNRKNTCVSHAKKDMREKRKRKKPPHVSSTQKHKQKKTNVSRTQKKGICEKRKTYVSSTQNKETYVKNVKKGQHIRLTRQKKQVTIPSCANNSLVNLVTDMIFMHEPLFANQESL
jgi:hypothetical protein